MKRKGPFDWGLFMQDPEFVKNIIFSPTHIDCHLSEKGRQEVFPIIFSAFRLAKITKISIQISF